MAIAQWRTNHLEEVEFQKEKIRQYLDIIETLPANCHQVERMRNEIMLFEKLHELDKISPDVFLDSDDGQMQFVLIGRMGKNTQKHFEKEGKLKIIEQDGELTAGETTSDDIEGSRA